jgi:hypothetical protein
VTSLEEPTPPVSLRCWCCDREYDERELVRLAAHPEVAICAGCALALKQRAGQREDELRPTPLAQVRIGVRRLRERVIARDWHNKPLIGPLLRSINRHLP